MKHVSILIIFLVNHSWCQLNEFNSSRYKTDQHLMIGLGSWAAANLVGSGIGWATAPNDEMKYFHQMNVMWNAVNLGLSIPGYLKARNASNSISLAETIEEQRKTETIFLFNSGLDLAYIGSGMILRSESKSNPEKAELYNGFGNSLILQGGFLLIFDWVAYSIHRKRAKKKLSPFLERLELSNNKVGLKLNLSSR